MKIEQRLTRLEQAEPAENESKAIRVMRLEPGELAKLKTPPLLCLPPGMLERLSSDNEN